MILRNYFILLLYLITGLCFFSGTSGWTETKKSEKEPQKQLVLPPQNWLDTTPIRDTRKLLLKRSSGFVYRCMECHKDFKTPLESVNEPIGEHQGMIFDHGLNINCLSCHHPENRGVYIDHDFREISEDQSVYLCRKCHGPVYRDWEAGIHGRMNGYWDRSRGLRTKLSCNQCHDPHQPAFKQLVPMAPPAASRLQRVQKGSQHD